MTSIAPKVSVVIPNYNGISYLRDCLESVYRESVVPDRVIVVDNGSKDGSAEEAEQLFPEAEMLRMGRRPQNVIFPRMNPMVLSSGFTCLS